MNHIAHNAFPVGRWTLRTQDLKGTRKTDLPEGTRSGGRVGCQNLFNSVNSALYNYCQAASGVGHFEPSSDVAAVRQAHSTDQSGNRLRDSRFYFLPASIPLGSLLLLNPKLLS